MAVNNNVTLIGRLTKDVELRKTPTGLSVAQITVACNKKTNGEKEADFINCVVWKQSAEYLHTYAKKGTLVALNGRIQTRSYDNQQGQKVYITEVVAEQVTILASSNSSTPTSNQVQTTQAPKVEDSYSVELDICEDDLPF